MDSKQTNKLLDAENNDEPIDIYQFAQRYARNRKRKEAEALHRRINPDRSLPVVIRYSLCSPYGSQASMDRITRTFHKLMFFAFCSMIPEGAYPDGITHQSIHDDLFKK